jgi:hypothetical protein
MFISTSVTARSIKGQFSMLLVDICVMRLHETAKYFAFNTFIFVVSVILFDRLYKLGSNTGSIFVDSFLGGGGGVGESSLGNL